MRKASYILLLAALLHIQSSNAFTPQCISVGAAGNVMITWDRTGTAAANFRCWYIYHSTAPGGPFTAIDSVFFYTDTTENHLTANAANNPAYYFISFKTNNGAPDINSDTMHVINLNVNNSGGYANLSWNPTHIPLNPDDSPYYHILREYPAGFFTLIDSIDARLFTGNMTYSDLITICDDTIKYRIEVRNSSGCRSTSALKGDRFQDTQVPAVPQLDSVSVDVFGNAIIGWQPSTSPDTREYIVFLQGAGVVTVVDTVVGINSTSLQTIISGLGSSQTFFILAIDNCNNVSGTSQPHTSMYLTSSFDRCAKTINLSWSAYDFWGTPPQYEVFVSINGGTETFAGSTSSTSFADTNLTSGAVMCYRVRAVDIVTARSTTSNRSCEAPSFPPPPSFCYVRKATVISPNEINVVGYVDPAASVSGYSLQRANTPGGPFSVVSTINVSGTTTVSFLDNVPAANGPYYYFISALDSCQKEVYTSQIVQTMVLDAIANNDYTNEVSWTEYSGWPTGVNNYNLLLTMGGFTSVIPITSPMLPPFSVIDSVLDNFYSDGKFCYVIEAIEEAGNPYFFLDTARSNEVCIEQPPLIFIPNAFHPGGNLNNIFYPSNAFVSAEGYNLYIYNRWGELIFHTNDPLEGWPGTSNGVASPEGVYVYKLVARNGKNADIEKVGSVTLIR